MTTLKFEIVPSDIRGHACVRIQQGQVHVGSEPQGTYLRSCVCVGFYHPGRHLGALSHITGFSDQGGHGPGGALREIERGLARHEVRLADCDCFVIGGTDIARHVYDATIQELRLRRLRYRELDVLGSSHRKLLLDPVDGKLRLYKKTGAEAAAGIGATFSSDSTLQCFHDHRRRLLTGASLFFRNEALLQSLRETVLPEVLRTSDRCHIWCAGCSTGMETYSVGMVALDFFSRRHQPQFDVRLLGTDISAEALAQGRLGEYLLTERAAECYAALLRDYSDRVDAHTIRLRPELRSRVSFAQRDVRAGSRQHRFELVVCDHVLQYFTPDLQIDFLEGLCTGVQHGGFLYVSSPSTRIPETLLASGGYERLARSFYRRR